MKYQIKYYAETGNSFGKEDYEDVLECTWEDLKVAKEALKRIKEHYKWYEAMGWYDSYSFRRAKGESRPEPPKWWRVKEPDKSYSVNLINLPVDNGNEFQMHCPWCGYFDQLYSAEIIGEDSDMRFEV